MESFLPSEVARLVYGYLELECTPAAESLLQSCSHLQECQHVARRGRKFNTKILGRNLVGILDLICEVSSVFKDYLEEVGWVPGENEKLDEMCRLLNVDKSVKPKKQTSSVSITSTCGEISHSDFPEQKFSINCRVEAESDPAPQIKSQVTEGPKAEPVAQLKSKDVWSSSFSQVVPSQGIQNSLICQPFNVVQMGMLQSQMGAISYPAPQGTGSAPPVSQSTLQMIAPGQGLPLIMQIPATSQSSSMPSGMQIKPENSCSSITATSVASSVTPSTSLKPPRIYYPREIIPQNEASEKTQILSLRRKRAKPSPFPKLRAIAPKITRTLENGVEVQVIHTKENPLTDPAISSPLIDTSSVTPLRKLDIPVREETRKSHPTITRGSLRPRKMKSMKESSDEEAISPSESPPSPLFIDIETIKQ